MSTAMASANSQRFLRRTSLQENEYHTNFRKLDRDIISALVSDEASRVTAQMSKVYLSLINAPAEYWERDGVLRFAGEEREGKCLTAWEQLISLLGVASATARKALQWMSEQAIIGYYAGRNGAGIRIFINRAHSSIGSRPQHGQKNLRLVHTSSGASPTSQNDMPFKDSYAVLEILDTDLNSRAPKNGADNEQVDKISSEPTARTPTNSRAYVEPGVASPQTPSMASLDDVVARLKAELEPTMRMAARQAAAREHERTRAWLENRGLPKAARVAQHEAYNVLRKYGLISESARSSGVHANVGRSVYVPPEPHTLSSQEIIDFAGACIALLETKGQSIEVTLAEMSVAAGGTLLPEDAVKVREKANALLSADNSREGK
jgi:hypothetical protein